MQIDLKLQQKQTLSHAQIQSLNVLAYDCVELNQFLQDEYLENPLLDYTETVANPAKTDAPPAYAARSVPSGPAETWGHPLPGRRDDPAVSLKSIGYEALQQGGVGLDKIFDQLPG